MQQTTNVWDPLVRFFHWTLVATFITAYITAEEESELHILAGYTIFGLIIFRLIWGFVGSRHARFSDFITTPSSAWQYVKDLARKPRRYLGHNPAGGWMVLFMLLTLSVVTFSGFKVYAIEEGKGPLAENVLPNITLISAAYADSDSDSDSDELPDEKLYESDEEFWEEIHETSTNFMLLLILLHITGVIVMSRVHNESLVKAMFTGRKKP